MNERSYSSYPAAFIEHIKSVLGNETEEFFKSLHEAPPTSIRLHPIKKNNTWNENEKVPWCDSGRYLSERPSFTFDAFFHAGTYYVQEASSMFLEVLWKHINPQSSSFKVLDMCAAPGGKSTHLLSLLNKKGLLVSNEVIASRNKVLQQNISKWGFANSIVTQNNPEAFTNLPDFFDIVLVDAPCSGEGLFRKDKNAIKEWSEKSVANCTIRQHDILQHAIHCLKPGGFLIYSTCTYQPGENDLQVEKLPLEKISVEAPDYGQVETKHGFQFFPHKVKGEGFYIALLQKPGTLTSGSYQPGKRVGKVPDEWDGFLENSEYFQYLIRNNFHYAIPLHIAPDLFELEKKLYIRQAGICLGTLKGNHVIPSAELALSLELSKELPKVSLSDEQAISFLRSETFKLTTEKRGWHLAEFGGHSLGWVKILDGRINNYYPKEWRILKQQP